MYEQTRTMLNANYEKKKLSESRAGTLYLFIKLVRIIFSHLKLYTHNNTLFVDVCFMSYLITRYIDNIIYEQER